MFRRKPARRVRRRARKSNIGPRNRRVAQLTLKPYKYHFSLKSQALVPTNVPGQLIVAPGGGVAPIRSASNWNVVASATNFVNLYDIGLATYFTLEDLNYYANFTSMYDAYKITKVNLSVEYLQNMAISGQGANPSVMPTIYFYWDQDDASPPTSLITLTAKQGVKQFTFGNQGRSVLKTSFVPLVSPVVGTSQPGTVAGIVPSKKEWVNCTAPNVIHNALKMFITDVYLPGGIDVATCFRFNWTYDVSFRSPLLCA